MPASSGGGRRRKPSKCEFCELIGQEPAEISPQSIREWKKRCDRIDPLYERGGYEDEYYLEDVPEDICDAFRGRNSKYPCNACKALDYQTRCKMGGCGKEVSICGECARFVTFEEMAEVGCCPEHIDDFTDEDWRSPFGLTDEPSEIDRLDSETERLRRSARQIAEMLDLPGSEGFAASLQGADRQELLEVLVRLQLVCERNGLEGACEGVQKGEDIVGEEFEAIMSVARDDPRFDLPIPAARPDFGSTRTQKPPKPAEKAGSKEILRYVNSVFSPGASVQKDAPHLRSRYEGQSPASHG